MEATNKMKKSTIARIAASTGVPACAVFVAWCGGYNFDARNIDVAFGALFTIIAAVFAAIFPFSVFFKD